MIKLQTAGESHGESLIGIISGLPANLFVDIGKINQQLYLRQAGYGRSKRMDMEKDQVKVLSGISKGFTTGGPIAIEIKNRGRNIDLDPVYHPRPGHGDLAGMIKYQQEGARNIIERASARETAMRVALSSICRQVLEEFNITFFSHSKSIGGVVSGRSYYKGLKEEDLVEIRHNDLRILDRYEEARLEIEDAIEKGDSLGGQVELIVRGLPIGLGSHTDYYRKLDGKLAAGIMSLQGIKSVEIGRGLESSTIRGSAYHDEIAYGLKGIERRTNNAGGLEAGITNGEDLVVSASMKPIPTLMSPLETIDIRDKTKVFAKVERSDTCAVPSAGVVIESIAAHIICEEFLIKFSGDSMEEIKRNYRGYKKYIEAR